MLTIIFTKLLACYIYLVCVLISLVNGYRYLESNIESIIDITKELTTLIMPVPVHRI